jgi:hypothetical protein
VVAWRNCKASLALVAEINAKWPNRDKASDGTVGDAAHQAAGTSDHLPNADGVVRARDIDKDGIDAAWLAEYLRKRGALGDPRLRGGGYVIFNRRITTPDFSTWKVYTGKNPHTAHIHVSFTRAPAGYDSTATWGLTGDDGERVLRLTDPPMQGNDVRELQRILTAWYPSLEITVDGIGIYGTATEAAVRELQRRSGLEVDGIAGPLTLAILGLGGG